MRPSLNMLAPSLIEQIIDESKRVLAEIGIEARGERLKQRLIDAGLPTDTDGKRILFLPEIVDQAIADVPESFTFYDRDGRPHASWAVTTSISSRLERPERPRLPQQVRPAWPTRPISSSTYAWPMGWSTSGTSQPPFPPTQTSMWRFLTPGGCISA